MVTMKSTAFRRVALSVLVVLNRCTFARTQVFHNLQQSSAITEDVASRTPTAVSSSAPGGATSARNPENISHLAGNQVLYDHTGKFADISSQKTDSKTFIGRFLPNSKDWLTVLSNFNGRTSSVLPKRQSTSVFSLNSTSISSGPHVINDSDAKVASYSLTEPASSTVNETEAAAFRRVDHPVLDKTDEDKISTTKVFEIFPSTWVHSNASQEIPSGPAVLLPNNVSYSPLYPLLHLQLREDSGRVLTTRQAFNGAPPTVGSRQDRIVATSATTGDTAVDYSPLLGSTSAEFSQASRRGEELPSTAGEQGSDLPASPLSLTSMSATTDTKSMQVSSSQQYSESNTRPSVSAMPVDSSERVVMGTPALEVYESSSLTPVTPNSPSGAVPTTMSLVVTAVARSVAWRASQTSADVQFSLGQRVSVENISNVVNKINYLTDVTTREDRTTVTVESPPNALEPTAPLQNTPKLTTTPISSLEQTTLRANLWQTSIGTSEQTRATGTLIQATSATPKEQLSTIISTNPTIPLKGAPKLITAPIVSPQPSISLASILDKTASRKMMAVSSFPPERESAVAGFQAPTTARGTKERRPSEGLPAAELSEAVTHEQASSPATSEPALLTETTWKEAPATTSERGESARRRTTPTTTASPRMKAREELPTSRPGHVPFSTESASSVPVLNDSIINVVPYVSPISSENCVDCVFVDSFCHKRDLKHCNQFVECFLEANSIRAYARSCAFGLYWDSAHRVCAHASHVDCPQDPCRSGNVETHAYPNNCAAYWKCDGTKSIAKCCGEGEEYLEGEGCVAHFTCDSVCPLRDTFMASNVTATTPAKPKCSTNPYELDDRYYLETIPGYGQLPRPCSDGTIYNHTECRCVRGKSKTKQCEPEMYLNFENDIRDRSRNGLPLDIQNVIVTKGKGDFNGTGKIISWRFSGAHLGSKLFIRLSFKEKGASQLTETILANCDPNSKNESVSVQVAIDRNSSEVIMKADTYSSEPATLRITYTPHAWKNVTFSYDGKKFTGKVGKATQSMPLYGKLEASPKGLVVGGCGKSVGFTGYLGEVYIYRCIP